jgi:UDP-N-acetylglucosamine 2-epimerase
MRVLTVVGNRPQFVKSAAVSRTLRERHEEVLVHTGQHYDDELSAIFFRELDLPAPDHELGVGGGTNTHQLSSMLARLEPLIASVAPDVVLVYGDTNSTLAGALAGAQARVAVVHVEAGMRSGDWSMPEELNRVLTDSVASLLLCPSQTAVENLAREHVHGRVGLVGDVMVDVAELVHPRARERRELLDELGLVPGAYLLATAHRAGNVDEPDRLELLVELLLALPGRVVLPLHPRTRARLEAAGLAQRLAAAPDLTVLAPVGYVEFAALLTNARAAVTDSGGVQKEAYLASVPCVTLRDRTEWVETVEAGWNVLVDLDREAALAALERERPRDHVSLYGDGNAGRRVVAALETLAP